MTIQELYDWAKENNCLDIPIAKHTNLGIYDIEAVLLLNAEMFNLSNDKVVVD